MLRSERPRLSAILVCLAVSAAFLVAPGYSLAEEDPEVERLERQVEWLAESVAELQNRVLRLERQLADDPTPVDGDYDEYGRPSKETLDEIVLPEDPSKEEVRDYIHRLRQVTSQQRMYSARDPQVIKLSEIESDNFDVLLEFDRLGFHELEAAVWLAGPDHKDAVLARLIEEPELVRVVVRKGWVKDAKPILELRLRQMPMYLPTEWIAAVASFRDPETYGALKAYLVSGMNRTQTFEAIKAIPDIALENPVAEAWVIAKQEGGWNACNFAQVALEYGHRDAVEFLLTAAESDEPNMQYCEAHQTLVRFIDFQGTPEEIKAWWFDNAHAIYFDEERRMFVVN